MSYWSNIFDLKKINKYMSWVKKYINIDFWLIILLITPIVASWSELCFGTEVAGSISKQSVRLFLKGGVKFLMQASD